MRNSVKVVVMGDISVGKTSILARYNRDEFYEYSESTIGAAFSSNKIETENGEDINLEIWDTAGQERYNALLPMYYRGASIVILVFDLNNKESFDSIKSRWLPTTQKCPLTPLVFIAANKSDLKQNVPDSELNKLPESTHCYKVSAKNGEGIKELFDDIIKNIVEHKLYDNKCDSLSISKSISNKPEREFCSNKCC